MNKKLRKKLEKFALKHKLILEEESEVGFGRPCVGYTKGYGYVDFNPYLSDGTLDFVFPDDEYYEAPVKDAYHKHDCLCVLVRGGDYNKALVQLGEWVDDIEKRGGYIVEYETGATGIQALLTGVTGHAFRFNGDKS